MRPKRPKTFKELEAFWYKRLAKDGFDDQEDPEYRLLKHWTGISTTNYKDPTSDPEWLDAVAVQPENSPVISSFPDPIFCQEAEFASHAEFDSICDLLVSHGNVCLTKSQVPSIWNSYLSGISYRDIGRQEGISKDTVLRVVNKLSEWMNLVDTRRTEDMETTVSINTPTTVCLRDFNPDTDSALLYATWRNALWYDQDDRDDRSSDSFFKQATKSIRLLLKEPDTKVKIACLSDAPDFIVGYSVFQGTKLLWIYVKIDYRVKKIGSLLAKGYTELGEPLTKIGKAIWSKKKPTQGDKDECTTRSKQAPKGQAGS